MSIQDEYQAALVLKAQLVEKMEQLNEKHCREMLELMMSYDSDLEELDLIDQVSVVEDKYAQISDSMDTIFRMSQSAVDFVEGEGGLYSCLRQEEANNRINGARGK